MSYLPMISMDNGPFFDPEAVEERGLEMRDGYQLAQPFPHITIDDFLPPAVLQRCIDLFPQKQVGRDVSFDRPQERLKSQFSPESLNGIARTFFYSLNSGPFIKVLENITGIQGLIPDPYFVGGGFHEIRNGGHLSVHADFNHHAILNLERRLNILIYLNQDWKEEYGGQLELWNNEMTECVQSVVPVFGRCVMFNTTSRSNHGNPKVVNHPKGISRKSIALYYYTATWSDERREHTTQFRVRQGSQDKADIGVKSNELIRDLLPPLLYRTLYRTYRKLRR